jgi:hypothetical protein
MNVLKCDFADLIAVAQKPVQSFLFVSTKEDAGDYPKPMAASDSIFFASGLRKIMQDR